MPSSVIVRVGSGRDAVDFEGTVLGVGAAADEAWRTKGSGEGAALLLTGDRDYAVALPPQPADRRAMLEARVGKSVRVVFPGTSGVRRRVAGLSFGAPREVRVDPLDLTGGREGSPALWLHADGRLATSADGDAPAGIDAEAALVRAARWISSRRTSTFAQLFPPSAFHPDQPVRTDRLRATQALVLLDQLGGALAAAAVGGEAARADEVRAAQVRSAALTVLSHVLATVLDDPSFGDAAEGAAARMFALIEGEHGHDTARPALRAHGIHLLQLRAPALAERDRERARDLLKSLVRAAPPYATLHGAWNFAMCSAHEFHEGECEIVATKFKWKEIPMPEGAPAAPGRYSGKYTVFEAPWKTPAGQPIRLFARSASPTDENAEMGSAYFTGLLINRHAQLGSFDMRAATIAVEQRGYKLMMNSQCAGLTTRFAISRMFPDADIYSSWDSTYFRTGAGGKVTASEGIDCFMVVLEGMAKTETFVELDARLQKAQWHHEQASFPGFTQFVGPAHPLFAARFNDVNQDGRADYYDGFLDFRLTAIAEDVKASVTPRDPGAAASAISGEAATGLGWAAGSMNRVTQYSDIWAGLPGESELYYAFESAGFFDQTEPPQDVPRGGLVQETGKLPAVCRFVVTNDDVGLRCDVMVHAWLSHAAKEMKRLLVAADAMNRALDLGHLTGDKVLMTPAGRRCAVLLTLAGLLEFPSDQNYIDGLWAMALTTLNFPEISRSLVRACITEGDHDMSNYYGSRRGLRQLLETLEKSEPVAWTKIKSDDATVGRAGEMVLG